MATVRKGNTPVLVVVDVQNDVVKTAYKRDDVVANIKTVVGKARTAGVPVIWVQHTDTELVSGTEGWKIVPELKPAAGEDVIAKNYNCSFDGTNLDTVLEKYGATKIVLAGAATNWCIRATAYGALDRGYDLSLISDAHTTDSIQLDDGRVIEARSIIDELNTVMQWVSYPSRENEATPAEEFEF